MNWIVILAGGSGIRLGKKTNKIFLKLKGKSIIEWSILKAEKCKKIDKILISIKKEDLKKIKFIIKNGNYSKFVEILINEESRQKRIESTLNYLLTKAKKEDLIGFHNAANPLVTVEELDLVFNKAKKYGSALLAMKMNDTIKISDKNAFVIDSPIRDNCWAAQTPQVARFDYLLKAFKKAEEENFEATDDSQIISRIGIKPKIVECSRNNFKITFLEDLQKAKKII